MHSPVSHVSSEKKLTSKFLIKLLPVILLIGIASLLWGYADSLKLLLESKVKSIETQCEFQSQLTCQIETELGSIELLVDRKIQSLEPFKLMIKSSAPQWQTAEIRFEGFYDYMGINRFDFKVDSADSHVWHAKGSIPICTTDAKTWRVIVNLKTPTLTSSHWFKIKTD